MSSEITWSKEAEERVGRAPAFLRSMVRNLTEKKAREAGVTSYKRGVPVRCT